MCAAPARDQVGVAQHLACGLGKGHQHLVAHLVAVPVIDLLEVVQVHQDHAKGAAGEQGALVLLVQALLSIEAAEQAGEGVVAGHALQGQSSGRQLSPLGLHAFTQAGELV